jgi:hypothetical protein
MDRLTDAQFEAAERRGQEMLEREPRAAAARYDAGRIVIDLVNGCSYAFPTKLVQELQSAGPATLSEIVVDGLGFNLHWPQLDVDLHVPALLAGIFGTRAWMAREFARMAGSTTSPAKAQAARENGAKGGRPRKKEVLF